MSAYSDWKVGALTDEEYSYISRHELGADHGEEPCYEQYDDDREILSDES